jgi:hypothetical protein
MEEARVGYLSFTHPLWRKVSQEAVEFIKKITARQIYSYPCLEIYKTDVWFQQIVKNQSM